MSVQPPEPIAIVGMACLFPRSPDLATYWKNIVHAVDCVTDVPEGHSWRVDEHWDPPVTLLARLVSIEQDAVQHLGQAAYVRGVLERT